MKQKHPKITVGKLHIMLPYRLLGKRHKTWCGRYISDVDWTSHSNDKTLASKRTCGACKRSFMAFHKKRG